MHHHAGRLVHNQQGLILIYYAQWDTLGTDLGWALGLQRGHDSLTSPQPVASLDQDAVHGDPLFADEAFDL